MSPRSNKKLHSQLRDRTSFEASKIDIYLLGIKVLVLDVHTNDAQILIIDFLWVKKQTYFYWKF
jgi:hypothetical protein